MGLADNLTYARQGLLGVLTPQANTTVEPEFATLLPPSIGCIAARLVSTRAALEDRLTEYFERLEETLDTFGSAPLGAVAVACTGPSYLIGPAAEDRLVSSLSQRRGVAVSTAAQALVAALQTLGARRLALVSPYPVALTQASIGYWAARGLEVAAVQPVVAAEGGHHSIYAIGSDAVSAALHALATERPSTDKRALDAVLLLGTGLPTLQALAKVPATLEPLPVLSSNLALVWHAMECLAGRHGSPSAHTLRALMADDGWRQRLLQRAGPQVGLQMGGSS